jgi:hypothetical protein
MQFNLFKYYGSGYLATHLAISKFHANEEEGTVSQNTTVIFGGAFYLG